jgi:hypothetical protein
MADAHKETGLSAQEKRYLREELWFILPFFIFSLYLFLGSFQYRFEASTVPKYTGLITAILTGMRLIYILFPKVKIGEFKEDGLAGEFDEIQDGIAEEKLKDHYQKQSRQVTFSDEIKAFVALIGCFLVFLLFGYLVGTFFVVVGTSYYYGYTQKGPILINVVSMYILVYVVLFKLLGAPEHFGLVLEPILKGLDII